MILMADRVERFLDKAADGIRYLAEWYRSMQPQRERLWRYFRPAYPSEENATPAVHAGAKIFRYPLRDRISRRVAIAAVVAIPTAALLFSYAVKKPERVEKYAPPVTLARSELDVLQPLVPADYRIARGLAADIDGDGKRDIVFAARREDDESGGAMLGVFTASQHFERRSFNQQYRSLDVGNNNGNSLNETYLTIGNAPDKAVMHAFEFHGGELHAIGEVPDPKITRGGIFSIAGRRKDGTPLLNPYVVRDGVFQRDAPLIPYPKEVRRAEEQLARLATLRDYPDDALLREIERITASLSPQYRAMAILGAPGLPEVAFAFAERTATNYYQEIGFHTPEQIRWDWSGNPYAVDRHGNRVAPRIAPMFTFSYGGQRIWRDPNSRYFYTVDAEGRLKGKFYVSGGTPVYSGPALSDFTPQRNILVEPQFWTGREGRTLVGETTQGGVTTRLETYGGASTVNSPAALAARSRMQQQEAEQRFVEGLQRVQTDLQHITGAAAASMQSIINQALRGEKQ